MPLLAGELVCRALGWGRPQWTSDPMVGLEPGEPLFVLDPTGQQYTISSRRLAFFAPDGFAAHKPDNEFRIFCLGGSTVQGRPYSRETSFTTWLELSLRATDSRLQWKVVNCGGVSYASYRLVPILEEVLRHKPDLVILCTGHNEFLEDRTYGHLKRLPLAVRQSYRVLGNSRLFSALLQTVQGPARADADAERPLLPAEVDALLDYRGGLEAYRRDDIWRRDVEEHYQLNLRRMAALCRENRVPLLLVNPVSNVKDCPPFKIEADRQLSAEQRREFDSLWQRVQRPDTSTLQRLDWLRQAADIDPRHAGVRFELGKCLEALNRPDEAAAELIRAKDEDVCPLRMLESLHARLQTVASEQRLPVVDVRRQFESESPQNLVGDAWMLDHVHPTIEGHQRIASMLLDEMTRQGWVRPQDASWRESRQALYRQHLDSLDALYFVRGRERLEGLRRWTQGRSNKLPAVGAAAAESGAAESGAAESGAAGRDRSGPSAKP